MCSCFFFAKRLFVISVSWVGTCRTCMPQVTRRGSVSTLSTSGSCSWCRTAETSSSAAKEVSEKLLFSISNRTLGWCHVSLEVAEGREIQLPLRHSGPLPTFPAPSPPSQACSVPGLHVYFFMNVWIRWKRGSVGFGFGFQSLTCYHTHTRTHTHSPLLGWIGTINPN